MPHVPHKKKIYSQRAMSFEKVTHHATSAKMHNQLAKGGILKQFFFTRPESNFFFFTGGKTKSDIYYRG